MTVRIELENLKAELEKIVNRVSGSGDEVVVEDHGRPLVRLTAAQAPAAGNLRSAWQRLEAAERPGLNDDEIMDAAVKAQKEYRAELRRKLASQ